MNQSQLLVIIVNNKAFDLYIIFNDLSFKIKFLLCFIFVFNLNYNNLKVNQLLQLILIKLNIITKKH